MTRKIFYDIIRKQLFGGKMSPSQVQGIEATLNYWEQLGLTDIRWLAYIIATDFHESNRTMQAVKEIGGDAYYVRKYWTNKKKAAELGNRSAQDAIDYCGKGKPQTTGRGNYTKMGKILSIDLVNNPDLALNLDIATQIMFEGMTTGKSFRGDFTGKHLGNFFNKTTDNPLGARSIVNGKDKAKLIADYHYIILSALKAAMI